MVRARRIFLKMSQTALGDQVGLTFQQIQKYENGINRISAARLKEIGDALSVPVAYFFKEVEKSSDEEFSPINFLTTSLNLRLLKAFEQISDIELREGIVKLVEMASTQKT